MTLNQTDIEILLLHNVFFLLDYGDLDARSSPAGLQPWPQRPASWPTQRTETEA